MALIFKPIKLNEQSPNVALLHQVLATFGLTVTSKEVSEAKAGKDKQEKVRALRKMQPISVRNTQNAH